MRKDYTHNLSNMDLKLVILMCRLDVHHDHNLDYAAGRRFSDGFSVGDSFLFSFPAAHAHTHSPDIKGKTESRIYLVSTRRSHL